RCAASVAVDVAEVASGRDAVAHPLLEHGDLREAAVPGARPDPLAIHMDLEHAAGAGDQRQPRQLVLERGQQLLSHPAGAQQPAAAGAVVDLDVVVQGGPPGGTGSSIARGATTRVW